MITKYQKVYFESLQIEYAATDPETQGSVHHQFMKKIFFVSLVGIAIQIAKSFYLRQRKRYMGVKVHQDTLSRIMKAPVNLFFDVTPIGRILRIFTVDMSVF